MSTRRDFLKAACLSSAAAVCPTLDAGAASEPQTGLRETLPNAYYPRLAKWCDAIRRHLEEKPDESLAQLEKQKGWRHFPYSILVASALYALPNRANPKHGDPSLIALAKQIGDRMVREDEAGNFSPRLDSDRDTYMWLEAYGLIKKDLEPHRDRAWRAAFVRNINLLLPKLRRSKDIVSYTGNFLGTSPNHVAWWAATVLVGGIRLDRPEWVDLGSAVLRNFATVQQNPDGYWGEHNPNGPTGGYNYLTTMTVGIYWEHTHDPAAMEALQRATEFQSSTVYSDGTLIELFNDRNRYWEVSPWAHFAFSHFPSGRGFAQMLLRNIPDEEIDLTTLGVLALNALYYHPGPVAPSPSEKEAYAYRITSPIGVRKQGPWIVGLSGIVDSPLPESQWFLDRQANLSVFHERAGLIVCGANSRHQPQLGTFSEKRQKVWSAMPVDGRLDQRNDQDLLAVAHRSFSAVLAVPRPAGSALEVDFRLNGRGPAPEEAYIGLQLILRPGQRLTTAGGRNTVVSGDRIQWSAADIAGKLRHGPWSLSLDADATLEWPAYPYNPYHNQPETKLEHAVALLRIPLRLKTDQEHWLQVDEQAIRMRVSVS